MLELEEEKYRDKIPSRAACFREEGTERSGPGTDSGNRDYNKPTWTSSRSPVTSREERPYSCRKLARGPWTLGKTEKRSVLVADYSVSIPVCLPWGIIPSRSEAPKKKVLRRCRDMRWLHAKRRLSYAEHEAGKRTTSWRGPEQTCLIVEAWVGSSAGLLSNWQRAGPESLASCRRGSIPVRMPSGIPPNLSLIHI